MPDKQTMPTMPELPERFFEDRWNSEYKAWARLLPEWLETQETFSLFGFRNFITAVLGWLARDLAEAWRVKAYGNYEDASAAIVEWREFEKAVEKAEQEARK